MRSTHATRYVLLPVVAGLASLYSIRWSPRIPAKVAPARRAVGARVPATRPRPRLVAVDSRVARRVNALRPTVKQRLEKVVAKLPQRVTLLVTSARRTRAEQAALKPTFGIKARPGTSPHEDGRAIDVNVLVDGKRISPSVSHRVIGVAMASEGFHYLGPQDPVHYSVPKEDIDLALRKGPALEPMTMDEMLALEAEDAPPAVPATQPVAIPVAAPAMQRAVIGGAAPASPARSPFGVRDAASMTVSAARG